MYSSNENLGFPIIVNYKTKNRTLFKEKLYSKNTFNSLLDIYEKNNKYKNEAKLKSKYFINGVEIKGNQLLEELIEKNNYKSSDLIEISLELEELYYLNDSKDPSYNKIIQPKANPFSLLIISPKEKKLSLKRYPDKTISLFELDKFNQSSSYCNSLNDLFISEEKDFWSINNNDFTIKKKNMPSNKRNHSMIFLEANDNNELVFIVGGEDKKSFYYDLNKSYFINWGETNEIHFKPALIKISEYLYIFDSINLNNNFFERTKIVSPIRKWEKIIPNLEENIINNFPSKFGVSFDSNGNILFLGGDNNVKSSYIYNPGNNIISLSKNGRNDNMIFDDKTFYKISDKYNIALPHDLNESKEISIVDKVEQSLIKINIDCPTDDNDTIINCNISFEDNIQNNNNNDVGYLTIKTTSDIEVNKNIPTKIIDYNENINNIEQPFISDSCVKNNNKDEINNTYVSRENPKVTIIYDEYFPTLNKNENYRTKYYHKTKNNIFNRKNDKSNVEIIYDEYTPIKVDYELSKPGEMIKYIPKKHKAKKNNKNKEENHNNENNGNNLNEKKDIENVNNEFEENKILKDKEEDKQQNVEENNQQIDYDLNNEDKEINEENNEVFNENNSEINDNLSNKNEEEIEIKDQENDINNEDENINNENNNEINSEEIHKMNEDENEEKQNNSIEYIENGNEEENNNNVSLNEENQIAQFEGEEINVEENGEEGEEINVEENGEEIDEGGENGEMNYEEMNYEGKENEEEMEEEDNNNEENEEQNSINEDNHSDNKEDELGNGNISEKNHE